MYQTMSSKYDLARQYLVDNLGMARDAAAKLENSETLNAMAAALHNGAGGTVDEATRILWSTYHPWRVWYYLGAFGLAGTVGMVLFYFATRKGAKGA
jgi:hypothetical protein